MDPIQKVLYRKLMGYLSPFDATRIQDPLYNELKQKTKEKDDMNKYYQETNKFILKQLGQEKSPYFQRQLARQDINQSPSLSPKKKHVRTSQREDVSHTRSNSVFSNLSLAHRNSESLNQLQLGRFASEQLPTDQKVYTKKQVNLQIKLPANGHFKFGRVHSEPNLGAESSARLRQKNMLTKLVLYEEPVQHVWSELKFQGKLCSGRSFSQAVYYKGKLYFYGGYDAIKGVFKDFVSIRLSEEEPSSFENVDLSPESLANSPGRLCRHGAVLKNDSMIIFGGKSSSLQSTNGMYEFSFETLQFKKIKPNLKHPSRENSLMPTVDSHSLVYDKNTDSLILFGGYLGEKCTYSNQIFTFSFSTGEWEEIIPSDKEKIPLPRGSHGASLVDNKLYVFGGTDGESIHEDLWYFDFQTKTWNQIVPEKDEIKPGVILLLLNNIPRSGVSLIEYEGYFIVFGGFKSLINERNDMVIFNIAQKKWIYQSERKEIYESSQSLMTPTSSPLKSIKFSHHQSSSPTSIQSLPLLSPSRSARLSSPTRSIDSSKKIRLFMPLMYRDEVSEIIQKRRNGKNRQNFEKKMQLLRQFEVPEEAKLKLLSPIPVLQSMKNSLNMLSACNKSNKYDSLNQAQLKGQNLINTDAKISGKHPGARDGYLWAYFNHKLIIFGGDRHRMSLNDSYELDLPKLLNYLKRM